MKRKCKARDCQNAAVAKGRCPTHWARIKRGIPLNAPLRTAGPGFVDWQGYRKVYRDGKTQAEHRYIMARKLGRPLTRHEVVHHLNGDRLDNRVENLELWSHSQPCGQRVIDKLKWARELIALYEKEEKLLCTR